MPEVFQCQYCGHYAPLHKAIIAWTEAWQSEMSEDTVFNMSVTCSPSCADRVNDLRVTR